MPKIVNFGECLKTWSWRTNNVVRQVNFNRTKIGGKRQSSKIQMRHFEEFPNNVHDFFTWEAKGKLCPGDRFLLLIPPPPPPPGPPPPAPVAAAAAPLRFRRFFVGLVVSTKKNWVKSGWQKSKVSEKSRPCLTTDFGGIEVVFNDLPGGATIFCHFWKSVVFKQSLGLSA